MCYVGRFTVYIIPFVKNNFFGSLISLLVRFVNWICSLFLCLCAREYVFVFAFNNRLYYLFSSPSNTLQRVVFCGGYFLSFFNGFLEDQVSQNILNRSLPNFHDRYTFGWAWSIRPIRNRLRDVSMVTDFWRTLAKIGIRTRPSVQTVSDVCLKRTCSLDTNAFSTLEVLDDNQTLFTYLLTYPSSSDKNLVNFGSVTRVTQVRLRRTGYTLGFATHFCLIFLARWHL